MRVVRGCEEQRLLMSDRLNLNGKNILVTGSHGFIGASLVTGLLETLDFGTIVSLDNLNDYYDVRLKEWRGQRINEAALNSSCRHIFAMGSITDRELLEDLFSEYHIDMVVNLAAQAGVRRSLDCPDEYIDSNVVGFCNILEQCSKHSVEHLVYASSSSVYGDVGRRMLSEGCGREDRPASLYAATKKCDEILAHAYASACSLPCTGLRFFTVYGPAGRPDMFYYTAANKFAKDQVVDVYNHGSLRRDFTYIDDVVDAIMCVMVNPPIGTVTDDGIIKVPWAVYNVGCGRPTDVLEFLAVLHTELERAGVLPDGHELRLRLLDMQPGDVRETWADTTALWDDHNYRPNTTIQDGLRAFAEWYAANDGGKFDARLPEHAGTEGRLR